MEKIRKTIKLLFISAACCMLQFACECPKHDECPDCPECPELIEIDSLQIGIDYMESKKEIFVDFLDSLQTVKELEIEYLYTMALEDARIYREDAIYQVDTMRANFLAWQADTLQGINDYFDSLKGTIIYDNTIIYADSVNYDLDSLFNELFRSTLIKPL